MKEAKTKPIHEIRLGRIKAAIWESRVVTEEGERASYRVSFAKLYKDQDDQWKDTRYFDREDLLLVAEVARLTAGVL
jgi:hypothetical protein